MGAEHRQAFRTIAGMIAVITAVLTGSAAALIAVLAFDHSLAAALISGGVVAVAVLVRLLRFQWSALRRAASAPLIEDETG